LTDNTNLFGMPPSVRALLAHPPAAAVTRYPSPYADDLRAALARLTETASENIVTGCGSDDVLDATFRAFGETGETVAYCPPTFSIVTSFALANGLVPTATPLEVNALAATKASVIYLCSPNNPTGAVLPVGFLEALLDATRGLVVLDEAYIEYAAHPSWSSRAPGFERLLVVRTLSKAYGLAGLRVGYAVGHARLIEQIEKTRGPYKVGGLAEHAALAVLSQDETWVKAGVDEVKTHRASFIASLREHGFSPLPTEANFVLVPVQGHASDVATRMRAHGVSVRAFSDLAGIGEAVRISIGPAPLMQAALSALREACR
jgi:histidinol-phosphate aminotransferase